MSEIAVAAQSWWICSGVLLQRARNSLRPTLRVHMGCAAVVMNPRALAPVSGSRPIVDQMLESEGLSAFIRLGDFNGRELPSGMISDGESELGPSSFPASANAARVLQSGNPETEAFCVAELCEGGSCVTSEQRSPWSASAGRVMSVE